jgi:hypothetical protein
MNDDLNRLIHTNAHNAFEIGVRTEQQRIVNLVEAAKVVNSDQKYFLIQAIKEDQK